MNLREILGCVKPKPKVDDIELHARSMIRQLTLYGYEAYELWQISERMVEMSLNYRDYPDLFPQNQRPLKTHQPLHLKL